MIKYEATTQSRWGSLKLAVLGALVLAITLLAACGTSPIGSGTLPGARVRATATAMPPPLPTSIVVVRLSGFVEQNRVAPFQMTSQDAVKVVQLYQAARALPRAAPRFSCADGGAIGYEVSFMHGGTLVAQVLMIYGCRWLEISGLPGCRDWPPAFTAQLADTLGVAVTTLEPTPPNNLLNTAGPHGPFAQAFPTPPVLVSEKCSY